MDPQEDNMQLPAVQPTDPDDPAVTDHTQALQSSSDDGSATQQAAPFDPTVLQQQTSNSAAPPTAEDVDLIEKAWVEKAKNIVQDTMGDPHAQSEEINKMKADYIKKRYNKDIRSEE